MPIPFPSQSASSAHSSRNAPPLHRQASSSSSSSSGISLGSSDDEEEAAMIQAEWEESLRQMELVLSVVVIPFFGKWWGRRWAYWAWDRYLHLGWTRAFFGLH